MSPPRVDQVSISLAQDGSDPVTVPTARVALSTASVYPESAALGFELAAKLGYDAVELMVGVDALSQDVEAVKRLADYHEMPVCAVHAPCLLITQRVWGTDPWIKLRRSADVARALGSQTVVLHPPFRWQREYVAEFVAGVARMEELTGVAVAVENMYPWRVSRRLVQAYLPGWNPVDHDYAHVTLDLSHTSAAGDDPMQMISELGGRLHHVHMTDGIGSGKDEHLVPGRGNQPCAEVLETLATQGFAGSVVVEINTRKAASRATRQADIAEALAFTRLHLAAASSA